MGSSLLQGVVTWVFLLFFPTLCTALIARKLGVKIEEVGFGSGPLALRRGHVTFRWIPWNSFVRFKHTKEIPVLDLRPEDRQGALDQQPLAVRLIVALSGPLTLLAVGVVVLGSSAIDSFVSAFSQILLGALSPLGEAQRYLEATAQWASAGVLVPAGVVATKLAALQLLPLSGMPGLWLLADLVPAIGRKATRSPGLFAYPLIALALSWLLAVVLFLAV